MQSSDHDLASPRSRLVAWLIDLVAMFALTVVANTAGTRIAILTAITDQWDKHFGDLFSLFPFAYGIAALVVWHVVVTLMVARWGQSPGKMLLKIRIVEHDSTVPSFVRAIGREVLFKTVLYISVTPLVSRAVLELWDSSYSMLSIIVSTIFCVALWRWLTKDTNHQTLHDKVMGTFVVRA